MSPDRRRPAFGVAAVIALTAITACGGPATREAPPSTAPALATSSPAPTPAVSPKAPDTSPPQSPAPPTSVPSPASTPADQVGTSSAGLAAATTRPSPTRMMIPSLKIDMPLSPQGVDDIGLMALPPDPAEAGWYRFGPAAGDTQGATVIAAHVDSKELGIGPLADLRRLAPGEVIVVLDAAGVEHAYRVESVDSVPRAELDLAQLFARTGAHHLNLVTCGGPYLRDRGGYQNNVIARAVPVS